MVRSGAVRACGLDSVAHCARPDPVLVPPCADGRWLPACPDFLAHQTAHTQIKSAREGGATAPRCPTTGAADGYKLCQSILIWKRVSPFLCQYTSHIMVQRFLKILCVERVLRPTKKLRLRISMLLHFVYNIHYLVES
jgi:hypothetical protein